MNIPDMSGSTRLVVRREELFHPHKKMSEELVLYQYAGVRGLAEKIRLLLAESGLVVHELLFLTSIRNMRRLQWTRRGWKSSWLTRR